MNKISPALCFALTFAFATSILAGQPVPADGYNPVRLSNHLEIEDVTSSPDQDSFSDTVTIPAQPSASSVRPSPQSAETPAPKGLFSKLMRSKSTAAQPANVVASEPAVEQAGKTAPPSRLKKVLQTSFPELFPIPEGEIVEESIPPAPSFDSPEEIRSSDQAEQLEETVPTEGLPQNCVELYNQDQNVDTVCPQSCCKWKLIRCPGLSALFHKSH